MKENVRISLAIFKRLPLYLRILNDKKKDNVENISSTVLAKELNFTSIQVRKDLAKISDCEGKAGIGFNVNELINNIEELLGLNNNNDAIIIGAGSLGQALLYYNNFGKDINMLMAFDKDINKCDNKKIFHIDKLENLVKRLNIRIAILAIPKDSAQDVCDKLVSLGIKGIWNFAPIILKVPENVVVKNEDLLTSLLILLKKLDEKEKI